MYNLVPPITAADKFRRYTQRFANLQEPVQQEQPTMAKGSDDVYGVMPAAYAQSLAAGTRDPLYGSTQQAILANNSEGSLDRYEAMLEAAQRGAIEAENAKHAGEMGRAAVEHIGDFGKYGLVSDAYGLIPGFGGPSMNAIASDARTGQERHAGVIKDAGAGAKDFHDAGIQVDPTAYGRITADPLDSNPAEWQGYYGVFGPGTGGYNPVELEKDEANQIDREEIAARERIAATQAAAHVKAAGMRGGGSDTVTTVYLPDGKPITTTVKSRGRPDFSRQGNPGNNGVPFGFEPFKGRDR